MNLQEQLKQINPDTPEDFRNYIASCITFLQYWSGLRLYLSPEGYYTLEWSKEPFVVLLQFIEEKMVLTIASDILEEAVSIVLTPMVTPGEMQSFFDTVLATVSVPAGKDGQ